MDGRALADGHQRRGVGLKLIRQLAQRVAGMDGLSHPAYAVLLVATALAVALVVVADLPLQMLFVFTLWFGPPLLLLSALATRRLWAAQDLLAWMFQEEGVFTSVQSPPQGGAIDMTWHRAVLVR